MVRVTGSHPISKALESIVGCAGLGDLGRGAMQEINQVDMAAPVVKGSFMVHDARRIPDFIARAVRLAFCGRRAATSG